MSNEIVTVEPTEIEQIQMGSLTAQSSQSIVRMASTIATELAKIVEAQKLYTIISGKKFVQVEGWTTMGAMLGITPKERDVSIDENGDYEAHVDLIRNSDGVVVGGASSICGSDEKTWANRQRYARRSMAVTRATGKAFRLGYSWIMRLAGYEPTPYEEMPVEGSFEEIKESVKKSYTREDAAESHDFKNRPYDPDTLKAALEKKVATIGDYDASDKQRNLLGALLNEFFQDDQKRHTVQLWLTGSASVKDMSGAYVKAMLDWLHAEKDDSGAYVIDDVSRTELSHTIASALIDEGQEALL